MVYQLLTGAANELIGRLLWKGVGQLVRDGLVRRADPLADLPRDGGCHYQERHSYGARMIGPRYPGTF